MSKHVVILINIVFIVVHAIVAKLPFVLHRDVPSSVGHICVNVVHVLLHVFIRQTPGGMIHSHESIVRILFILFMLVRKIQVITGLFILFLIWRILSRTFETEGIRVDMVTFAFVANR